MRTKWWHVYVCMCVCNMCMHMHMHIHMHMRSECIDTVYVHWARACTRKSTRATMASLHASGLAPGIMRKELQAAWGDTGLSDDSLHRWRAQSPYAPSLGSCNLDRMGGRLQAPPPSVRPAAFAA